jgi:acetolactate synthase-1/2/3 large subunit
MKAADFIVDYLHQQGVPQIFEVIGGMITLVVDAAYRQKKIQLVSMHHEQAAAFAADAVGRLTGIPGVAMGTSGPGATNLITGIGSCYFDSSPTIFITGQVNCNEQKGNLRTRQLGFQETDIVSIVAPITKAAWRVKSANELPEIMRKAFEVSTSGRPGPVLVDVPMDVQQENIESELFQPAIEKKLDFHTEIIEQMLNQLRLSKRPLILAGGGIRASRSTELLREFIGKVRVPVVNTLLAVDALPFCDPQRVGLIGTYGNRWANTALGNADFLLVLGSRLDIRQTGSDTEAFSRGKVIFQVDCDESELNNRIKGCSTILSDLNTFLKSVNNQLENRPIESKKDWEDQITNWKHQWPDTQENKGAKGINPNLLMHQLSQSSPSARAFIVDVGNNQMWAAQSLELNSRQQFMTSGGMGSMGFALPASIGSNYAFPGDPVVMISGDGGMQMNIQEMETVKHRHLSVKMVVINNKSLGMVRQFQQSYMNERYQSTYWGYSAPDFEQIACAYGISAITISKPEEISQSLEKMWKNPADPFLLQVMVDMEINAYPKIAFGRPITDMEPFVKPIGMEST